MLDTKRYRPFLYSLIFTLTFYCLPFSFCFSQDITFNSQSDVDAFDPSITEVNGNLTIKTTSIDSITNLDNLSSIISVNGHLHITENNALNNINGLTNLTTIGADLLLQYNSTLQNIDSLINLTTIGTDLRIKFNAALLNIDGLANLVSINGHLEIDGNPLIKNIDGLANLTGTIGYLTLEVNTSLQDISGLANITVINGSIEIEYCSIQNLDGLVNLTAISNELHIFNNSLLTNCCAIQGLLSTPGAIGGEIEIYNNPSECSSENEILAAECDLVAVDAISTQALELHIHPNPSSAVFNIILDNSQLDISISQLQIVNTIGQVLYSKTNRQTDHGLFEIDLSDQPAGIYLYSFFDKNNRLLRSGKLVKQ